MMQIEKLFEQMLAVRTASGAEAELIAVIRKFLEPYTDELYTDRMGNLIAVQHANGAEAGSAAPKKIALFCGVDAPGMIVTDVSADGKVCIAPLGKMPFAGACYAEVVCGSIRGVLTPKDDKADSIEGLNADFGFADAEQAAKYVRQGDILAFASVPLSLADGKICAPGIGAKLAAATLCGIAAETALRQRGYDLYFVFCTQSALGQRGAYPAAFGVNADTAICIQPYAGDKIALKAADRGFVSDESLLAELEEAAHRSGNPLSRAVCDGEFSDAAKIQSASEGVRTAALLLPVQNAGTPREIGQFDQVRELAAVIEAFLNNK